MRKYCVLKPNYQIMKTLDCFCTRGGRGGGGDSHVKGAGVLVGKLELNP